MSSFWNKAPETPGPTARTAWVSGVTTEYNAFLYATISADANGGVLSVLSAMARMNLDAWQETAELTELSAAAAARRLASLIAAVPGGPSAPDAPGIIAARLVKLLPSRTRSILPILPPPKHRLGVVALARSRMALYVLFGLIALALAALLFGGHKQKPPPPNTVHVSETTQPTTRLVDTVSTPILLNTVGGHRFDLTLTYYFARNHVLEAYETFANPADTGAFKMVIAA